MIIAQPAAGADSRGFIKGYFRIFAICRGYRAAVSLCTNGFDPTKISHRVQRLGSNVTAYCGN